MNMQITEDYVSFEIAELFREKGFDVECLGTYSTDDKELSISSECPYSNDLNDDMFIAAPTLQMAMKWLREVHNLSVEVYRTSCGYIGCIVAIPSGTDIKFYEEFFDDDDVDKDSGQYTTWEKACKVAIKYCLTNII